jgi:hypothetical protein
MMRNQSTDPDPESALFLGIIFSIYAFVGIPANFFVAFATLMNDNLRSKSINFFVLSLSLSDMMSLFFGACSQMLWALTFDIRVCKVGGVPFYSFAILSAITPPFLAISRYVYISNKIDTKFKFLSEYSGVFLIIGVLWAFVFIMQVPFIIADKFGLDYVGVCGIGSFDSLGLLLYFSVMYCGSTTAAYVTTLVFYRKLNRWVREANSGMSLLFAEETIEGEESVIDI